MVSKIALHGEAPIVSRLMLGVWRMAGWGQSPSETLALIQRCLDLGITTFDHADLYGDYTCEGLFGDALKLAPHLRSNLQIVTKCGIKLMSQNRPHHTIKHYDTSFQHIIASVDHSLQQLHTDYLDVLLVHRPDPLLDADEVAAAFSDLKQSGKVRHFGVSNFSPSQFNLLASRLDFPLVTNQVEISVLRLDAFTDGTLDHCQQLRIAPMAWSPLGGGRLLGDSPQAVRLQQALAAVAQPLNATPDQIALAWLLAHPARIVPILGTGKLERILAAAEAEQFQLTREQWFAIWTASTGVDVP